MYVVLTLHLLHMQSMHTFLHCQTKTKTYPFFYNQPGHSPRSRPWLVFGVSVRFVALPSAYAVRR